MSNFNFPFFMFGNLYDGNWVNKEDNKNYGWAKLPKRLSGATSWIKGCDYDASRTRDVNLELTLPINVDLGLTLVISGTVDQMRGTCMASTPTSKSI